MICAPGETNPNYRHGLSCEGAKHPLYAAYYNMISRCSNTAHEKYHRYGGRGIIVCNQWRSDKTAFFNWAFSNGWQSGLTLDRRDNDGNYEPSNCQWIIGGLNSRKKSTTKLTLDIARSIRDRVIAGESETGLAKAFNVSHGTIWFIVREMTWNDL